MIVGVSPALPGAAPLVEAARFELQPQLDGSDYPRVIPRARCGERIDDARSAVGEAGDASIRI